MKHVLAICLLGVSIILPKLGNSEEKIRFQPLPFEDRVNGKNTYSYNAAIGKPASDDERTAFVNKVKPDAVSAQRTTKVPACAIGGMSVLESGYGFTRTGYFANNLFGIKKTPWTKQDTPDSWQLKGQPDESQGSHCLTKTVHSYGKDRLIFNEQTRCDNRYRKFNDYGEAIQFLAGTVLQQARYRPALEAYWSDRSSGKSIPDACKQYVCDIVKAGFSHIGCPAYLRKIVPVMDRWNSYIWAQEAEEAGGN